MAVNSVKKPSVKMAVALSDDGMPIHIDDAINGKACKSTCIDCGCPVIAKNRGKVAYHYAHDPEFYDPDACNWSPETELHLMAKMTIAKDQRLRVPIGTVEPKYQDVHFEDVKLEKRIDNRIPDIVAYASGELILIEIAVTHPCEPDKISEMKRANKNCVEIDLSEFSYGDQTLNMDTVRNFINDAPIKWLAISPVGDIGHFTYQHNLNLQRPLAAKVKRLGEELQNIESSAPLIREEHHKASNAIDSLKAKIAEHTSALNEQSNLLTKNKNRLERLDNFELEMQRFSEEKKKLFEKMRLADEKEQHLFEKETNLNHQWLALNEREKYVNSEIIKKSEDRILQIKNDLEADIETKKQAIERDYELLKEERKNFENIVAERVKQKSKNLEKKLLSDTHSKRQDILSSANATRKRTLELLEPLPAKLRKQFSKARAFMTPPYEDIEEIEKIIARLSKKVDS